MPKDKLGFVDSGFYYIAAEWFDAAIHDCRA